MSKDLHEPAPASRNQIQRAGYVVEGGRMDEKSLGEMQYDLATVVLDRVRRLHALMAAERIFRNLTSHQSSHCGRFSDAKDYKFDS